MQMSFQTVRLSWQKRLYVTCGIVALHIACYYSVNLINSWRPPSDFIDFYTTLDRWIPYLDWTWTLYYLGNIYITLWAAFIFWQMPKAKFYRALYAYMGMVILGAAIQVMIPGKAPWPTTLTGAQRWMHDLISMRPYACLPSMHVALTVFPACLTLSVLNSRVFKALSTILALLIIISTLTLKEHFLFDAVAGILLGLAAYAYWRRGKVPRFATPRARD